MVSRAVANEAKSAMGHNVVLIGGLWLVATVAVWLVIGSGKLTRPAP